MNNTTTLLSKETTVMSSYIIHQIIQIIQSIIRTKVNNAIEHEVSIYGYKIVASSTGNIAISSQDPSIDIVYNIINTVFKRLILDEYHDDIISKIYDVLHITEEKIDINIASIISMMYFIIPIDSCGLYEIRY